MLGTPRPLSIAVDPWRICHTRRIRDRAAKVRAFAINFDGSLSGVKGSPFAAGSFTSGVTVSANGRFVLVSAGPGVYVYSIDIVGALPLCRISPVAAGRSQMESSVDPNDAFVYVANGGSANVSAYAFQQPEREADAGGGCLRQAASRRDLTASQHQHGNGTSLFPYPLRRGCADRRRAAALASRAIVSQLESNQTFGMEAGVITVFEPDQLNGSGGNGSGDDGFGFGRRLRRRRTLCTTRRPMPT